MKLFDVYPRYPIQPVKGEGCFIWDEKGNKYLDLYGGHAVISIGHSHPYYVEAIKNRLDRLAYYSNSVQLPVQDQLAHKLGEMSGYDDYHLFLCNCGAEAIENALKVASFHTGRKKIIVFEKSFHGRTSLAVEATDGPSMRAPVNHTGNFIHLPLNDTDALDEHISDEVAAVMVEGIQGIAGIFEPEDHFMRHLEKKCKEAGAMFIVDEIQSGYGRTGRFFAHHYAGVKPDIITTAKGMGNGFPIGGVLTSPDIKAWPGMLGTTFGGSPLACTAGLAVLEVIEKEDLIANAETMGKYLMSRLKDFETIGEVRGKGLMVGISLSQPARDIRKQLIFEHGIFTGSSSDPHTLRLLPPLTISEKEIDYLIQSLQTVLLTDAFKI